VQVKLCQSNKSLRDLRDLESVLEESNDLVLRNLNVIAALLFDDSLEELDYLKAKFKTLLTI